MSLRLPPRYVNSPVRAIGHDLPDAENMMYIRMHALAWQTNGRETPPLPLSDLFDYLRVERSTFYKRLSRMAGLGWLRSTSPRPGFIKLFFGQPTSPPPWTAVHAHGQSTTADLESTGVDSARGNFAPPKKNLNITTAPNSEDLSGGVIPNQGLYSPPAWTERFEALALLPEPNRTQLARELSKTPEQIQSDITRWQKKGSPGIGLLVTMLRNDPPELDPDSEEARRQYISGEFADFIQH